MAGVSEQDRTMPDRIEPEEAERLALEAAVAEARAAGPGVPHEVVRLRLMEMARAAREAAKARGVALPGE
jgi:hypothetical protein